MARPKRRKKAPEYHCAMCDRSFITREDLRLHTQNHPDSGNKSLHCSVCNWPFDDSHALELHQVQAGHGTLPFVCENCNKGFVSQRTLTQHRGSPHACSTAPAVTLPHGGATASKKPAAVSMTCTRCPNIFHSRKAYNKHRSEPLGPCADSKHQRTPPRQAPPPPRNGYKDLDEPEQAVDAGMVYDADAGTSRTPSQLSEDARYCHDCKTTFKSLGQYSNHMLGCTQVTAPSKAGASAAMSKAPISAGARSHALTVHQAPPVSHSVVSSSTFVCDFNGCGKTCKSEKGLAAHKADVHGIGGQKLDMHGRDQWMLGPRERERLKSEGILRQSAGSSRGSKNVSTDRQPPPPATRHNHPPVATPPPPSAMHVAPSGPREHVPQQQRISTGPSSGSPIPSNMNMGGAAEVDQAKYIQGKTLRLLIQSDIFIHHDGKMAVCGVDWTRIGVMKQSSVASVLDGMCHLPKVLQGEYVPAPKVFKDEYVAQYPSNEFKATPARHPTKPGLEVVALSCSKVVLAEGNGRQEVVKVAAIDLVTCRILMNHLVCTDPHAQVKDWRSTVTGLFSWRDMEGARQAGYKVFKGWSAARSALWKFVDKETIIVGHNLRSDMDALRMIHGRAVDVAKVVEKAANGPLNKAQLGLDSLCRSYATVTLKSDPEYGRDSLMNAFAAREFVLWVIKNQERLDKDARQKSLDYQRIMPAAAVSG